MSAAMLAAMPTGVLPYKQLSCKLIYLRQVGPRWKLCHCFQNGEMKLGSIGVSTSVCAVNFGLMVSQGYVHEMVELMALAWPTYLAVICEVGLTTTAAVFLGHYGEDESILAGSYVAISVFNMLAAAPIAGLASALDTLSSQAFGAKQYHQVGVYLQRGLVVNLIVAMLVLPVLLYPTPVLNFLLGSEKVKVIQVSKDYLRWYAWGIFPLAIFDAMRRYLISQNIVSPLLTASATGLMANIILHYIFVVLCNLQHVGSAIAMTVSLSAAVARLLHVVIRNKYYEQTWPGVRLREAFSDLKPYMALGIPGVVQVCSEWWCFEASIFIVARWDEATIAAHVAMMNAVFIGYILPMSIGTASAVRVGNAIGAEDTSGAKLAAWCSLNLALASAVLEAGFILLFRNFWPHLYTSIPSITEKLVNVAPVFALFALSDNLQAVLGGILRGSGRQTLGALGNVVAFWMLGIPLGGWLCWNASNGVQALLGMWGGLTISEWINVSVIVLIVLRTNWSATILRSAAKKGEYRSIP